jgi:thioredoxin 1
MNVFKFSASWCSPCKAYSPEWNKVVNSRKSDKIDFKEVDIDDDSEDLVEKFKISSVPTTLIVDDGAILFRKSGFINSNSLNDEINKVLNN